MSQYFVSVQSSIGGSPLKYCNFILFYLLVFRFIYNWVFLQENALWDGMFFFFFFKPENFLLLPRMCCPSVLMGWGRAGLIHTDNIESLVPHVCQRSPWSCERPKTQTTCFLFICIIHYVKSASFPNMYQHHFSAPNQMLDANIDLPITNVRIFLFVHPNGSTVLLFIWKVFCQECIHTTAMPFVGSE